MRTMVCEFKSSQVHEFTSSRFECLSVREFECFSVHEFTCSSFKVLVFEYSRVDVLQPGHFTFHL